MEPLAFLPGATKHSDDCGRPCKMTQKKSNSAIGVRGATLANQFVPRHEAKKGTHRHGSLAMLLHCAAHDAIVKYFCEKSVASFGPGSLL